MPLLQVALCVTINALEVKSDTESVWQLEIDREIIDNNIIKGLTIEFIYFSLNH